MAARAVTSLMDWASFLSAASASVTAQHPLVKTTLPANRTPPVKAHVHRSYILNVLANGGVLPADATSVGIAQGGRISETATSIVPEEPSAKDSTWPGR